MRVVVEKANFFAHLQEPYTNHFSEKVVTITFFLILRRIIPPKSFDIISEASFVMSIIRTVKFVI